MDEHFIVGPAAILQQYLKHLPKISYYFVPASCVLEASFDEFVEAYAVYIKCSVHSIDDFRRQTAILQTLFVNTVAPHRYFNLGFHYFSWYV